MNRIEAAMCEATAESAPPVQSSQQPNQAPAPQPKPQQSRSTTYRVYANGKWWSWISGYNDKDSNGYAGTLKKPIDAVQIKNKTYRVSPIKSSYLGWISHYNTTNGNGYAGIYGKGLDRLQIK